MFIAFLQTLNSVLFNAAPQGVDYLIRGQTIFMLEGILLCLLMASSVSQCLLITIARSEHTVSILKSPPFDCNL